MTSPAPRLPDLSVLFPFRAWLRHPALKAWTTWLFVALVATPPLVLVMFRGGRDLNGVAIAFAAYFAAAWFLALWVVIRPQRVRGALVAQVVAVEAVLVLLFVAVSPGIDADVFDHLLLSISAVGVPEEVVKALPVVALALLHRRLSLTPRDVLFLAAVSGLVFGAIEAAMKTSDPGLLTGADAMWVVWRFATGPIAHAMWAGVAGYFIGIAVHYRHPGPWLALTGLGVGLPAVLHGINDWSPVTSGLVWALLQGVSALLFLAYAKVGLVARPAATALTTPASAPPIVADPPTVRLAVPDPVGPAPTVGRHGRA